MIVHTFKFAHYTLRLNILSYRQIITLVIILGNYVQCHVVSITQPTLFHWAQLQRQVHHSSVSKLKGLLLTSIRYRKHIFKQMNSYKLVIKQVVKIISQDCIAAVDGWFNRIRQVAPMCPDGATWQIALNWCFLRPTRVHNPNGKSMYCSWQKVSILYNRRPFPPKLPILMGYLDPHLTDDSLGQSERTIQTASRSVQLFSHRWPQCPCTLQWEAPFPLKTVLPMAGCEGCRQAKMFLHGPDKRLTHFALGLRKQSTDLSGPVNWTLYTQQASGSYAYTRWPTMPCLWGRSGNTPSPSGEMLCHYAITVPHARGLHTTAWGAM